MANFGAANVSLTWCHPAQQLAQGLEGVECRSAAKASNYGEDQFDEYFHVSI